MDVATIKRRAALGVVFLALRTVFVQLCILGSTVVLARALTPAEFGVYAILRFALTFFEFFGDAGIGGALVRKEAPPTRDELSNVFTFQCLVAGTLVVVVWLVASGIELIWSELPAGSAWLLRAMSLALLLTAARVAPAVLMERSLKFGHIALLEMLQTVAFYGVACALAVMGFGVRAWVYALLAQSATGLVGAYLMNPWRPGIELR